MHFNQFGHQSIWGCKDHLFFHKDDLDHYYLLPEQVILSFSVKVFIVNYDIAHVLVFSANPSTIPPQPLTIDRKSDKLSIWIKAGAQKVVDIFVTLLKWLFGEMFSSIRRKNEMEDDSSLTLYIDDTPKISVKCKDKNDAVPLILEDHSDQPVFTTLSDGQGVISEVSKNEEKYTYARKYVESKLKELDVLTKRTELRHKNISHSFTPYVVVPQRTFLPLSSLSRSDFYGKRYLPNILVIITVTNCHSFVKQSYSSL